MWEKKGGKEEMKQYIIRQHTQDRELVEDFL